MNKLEDKKDQHYDVKEATRTNLCSKEIRWLVLTVVVCSMLIILAINGFFKPQFT